MKNSMPTAKEFWKEKYEIGTDIPLNIMIEFTKLHVEAALKEASENAITTIIEDECPLTGLEFDSFVIDKKSILNAYSLENIK